MNLKQFKKHRVEITKGLDAMVIKLESSLKFLKTRDRNDLDMYHNYFLCNMCSVITHAYLISQKPTFRTNPTFMSHPSFIGRLIWWTSREIDIKLVIKEKIRFVKHIKAKL